MAGILLRDRFNTLAQTHGQRVLLDGEREAARLPRHRGLRLETGDFLRVLLQLPGLNA